jgi:hypothetical protein
VGVDAAAGTDTIRVRLWRCGREATTIAGIERRQRPRSRHRTDRHSVSVLRALSLPLIRLYPNTSGDCNGTFTGRALRAHEQQKARLAEQEAKLKDDERKARTRRLIQAGGLIEKAGLLDLEPNACRRRFHPTTRSQRQGKIPDALSRPARHRAIPVFECCARRFALRPAPALLDDPRLRQRLVESLGVEVIPHMRPVLMAIGRRRAPRVRRLRARYVYATRAAALHAPAAPTGEASDN